MSSESGDLKELIARFNDDFSNQRLDAVMEYFARTAEFRNVDGRVAKGVEDIRKAFKPLFDGVYGKVTFVEKHVIVDENKKQASFVWNCEHDLSGQKPSGLKKALTFSAMKARLGNKAYWEGIDYFIFDENNKITSKQTYGKSVLPKFKKA